MMFPGITFPKVVRGRCPFLRNDESWNGGDTKVWLISLSLLCCTMYAEDKGKQIKRNNVAVEMALTSDDTYSLESGYRFNLLHSLSAGVSLGYWKTFTEHFPHGQNWCFSDDYRKVSNFYLRPNVMLTTPKLFGIRYCKFGLYANPGVMLNIPNAKADIDIVEPQRRGAIS